MSISTISVDIIDDVAALITREHQRASDQGVSLPAHYLDVAACGAALTDLLSEGFSGHVAIDGARPVGVMCGRTFDGVGFVPAHEVAVDPHARDASKVMAELFAELAPVLISEGAVRVTVDHVDHDIWPRHCGILASDAAECSLFVGPIQRVTDQQERRFVWAPLTISIRLLRSVTSSTSTGQRHRCTPPTKHVPSPKPVPLMNSRCTTVRSICLHPATGAMSGC